MFCFSLCLGQDQDIPSLSHRCVVRCVTATTSPLRASSITFAVVSLCSLTWKHGHLPLYSPDTLLSRMKLNSKAALASPEHLNQVNVQGVPPHELNSDALASIVGNVNFADGLVNGQNVLLRSISPNSRVVQVKLLIPEKYVFPFPRNVFAAQVGRDARYDFAVYIFGSGLPTLLLSTYLKENLLAVWDLT